MLCFVCFWPWMLIFCQFSSIVYTHSPGIGLQVRSGGWFEDWLLKDRWITRQPDVPLVVLSPLPSSDCGSTRRWAVSQIADTAHLITHALPSRPHLDDWFGSLTQLSYALVMNGTDLMFSHGGTWQSANSVKNTTVRWLFQSRETNTDCRNKHDFSEGCLCAEMSSRYDACARDL